MACSKKSNSRIRVATFNIGDFTTATESAGNHISLGSGTQKTLEEYIAVFNKAGADLWGLQEDSEFFFYPEKILPYNALYKHIHPNHQRVFTKSYNGKAFLTRFPLSDVAPVDYPATVVTSYAPDGIPFAHKWFLTGKITVDGKQISLVCVHLDWQCKEKRAVQIAEVIKFAKAQEYCIILGDFNPENLINSERQNDEDTIDPDSKNMYISDWKKFSDAGFENINGGKFGPFPTLMREGQPGSPYPWDNIVVTPNIKVLNAETICESWMNDHAILVADLEIT